MGISGEYSQLSVLSDLVGSLTKIVQSMTHVDPVNAVSVPDTVAVAAPSVLSEAVVQLQVPKVCFKEALPCKVSLLGFHVSAALKENERGFCRRSVLAAFS